MKEIHEIRCQSRDEMMRVADLMIGRGFSVKAQESCAPFQQYGLYIPVYKVIFWKKQRKEKRAICLVLQRLILGRKKSGTMFQSYHDDALNARQEREMYGNKAGGKYPIVPKTTLADTGTAR